jgi:hypothetical protein
MSAPIDIPKLMQAMIVISDHFSRKFELPITFPTLEIQHPELLKLAQHQREQLLSQEDVARMLDVSPKTLANWRCRGIYGPKHVNIGNRIAYRRKDILDFITVCVRQSTSEKITVEEES